MSQKFDELKQKLANIDKDQVMQVINEIRQANQEGKIDENEKNDLLSQAKKMAGNLDIGGMFGGKK